MGINKEREAFEAYMAEKYKNLMDRRKCLNNGGGYMAWDMNVAWQVWQAAKAQAAIEIDDLKAQLKAVHESRAEFVKYCNVSESSTQKNIRYK